MCHGTNLLHGQGHDAPPVVASLRQHHSGMQSATIVGSPHEQHSGVLAWPLERGQQATELLLGKAVPPQAFTDDTAGRVLDRLYDFGTRRLFTACAVRAATQFGLERRSVHFDTTSRRVWGEYQFAETQDLPFQVT